MKAKNEQNSILYSSLEFGLTCNVGFFGTGNLVNDVTSVRPIAYAYGYGMPMALHYA